MIASIWSVASQHAAAICLLLISSPTPLADGSQRTSFPVSTITQNDASARQSVEQDLPHFSIEATPLILSRRASQILDTAATSVAHDDSEKHQPADDVPEFGNTRGDDITIVDKKITAQAEVFTSLDYAVLTPQYTFSSDTDLPFLSLNLASGQTTEILLASWTEDASDDVAVSPQANIEVPQPDAESVGSQALQDIINRPMSAIRLGAALEPVTAKGDALKTPEGISEHQNSRAIETHYIAAPWTIARPPNFTYPIKYQPLYFEDPNLERCGASYGCLTEFSSIAHMGMRIPLIPYLMASNSPHECVRALPDCPTCCRFGMDAYIPQPTAKATAVEAAAIVGFIFLIP